MVPPVPPEPVPGEPVRPAREPDPPDELDHCSARPSRSAVLTTTSAALPPQALVGTKSAAGKLSVIAVRAIFAITSWKSSVDQGTDRTIADVVPTKRHCRLTATLHLRQGSRRQQQTPCRALPARHAGYPGWLGALSARYFMIFELVEGVNQVDRGELVGGLGSHGRLAVVAHSKTEKLSASAWVHVHPRPRSRSPPPCSGRRPVSRAGPRAS